MHLIMKLKARFFMEMQLVIFFFFGGKKKIVREGMWDLN